MADFTSLNPIYGSFFTTPNPPSRVTISCGELLPLDADVVLSAIVDLGDRQHREGLHVQSRSYWAPANIGPYSQAISVPFQDSPRSTLDAGNPEETDTPAHFRGDTPTEESTTQPSSVHIAGQIPLVPASMEMVTSDLLPFHDSTSSTEKDFIAQATLSLQHLFRIGRAMNIQWWTGAAAFISSCSLEEGRMRAKLAIRAWNEIHRQAFKAQQKVTEDDDEELDQWELQNRRYNFNIYESQGQEKPQEEKDTRIPLPNYSALQRFSHPTPDIPVPMAFVAQIASLPRDADIEWFSNGITHLNRPVIEHQPQSYHALDAIEELSMLSAVEGEEGIAKGWRSEWAVYTSKALPEEFVDKWRPFVVPCFRVWRGDGAQGAVEVDACVIVRRYWD
jgi:diphthine-ammonia ligase